jgi:folate-dependent phosphoribosylglycinamide formyltransferase PurN
MRAVLLCPTTLNGFQRDVVAALWANPRHEVVGCLIDPRPPLSFRRRLARNARRGRGGFMVVMAVRRLRSRRHDAHSPTVSVTDAPCVEYAPGQPLPTALDEWRPDVLVLVGGYGIIKEPLLSAAPGGVIAYHHGDMRRYRGQPPGFWEVRNGERIVGVTVQRLVAELDAGEAILERHLPIAPGTSVGQLTAQMFAGSSRMMSEALDALQDPEREPIVIDAYGPLYTLPNLRQWLVCQARVARRRLARG